jgi:aspartate/methionine/tyrosine aminotransferase
LGERDYAEQQKAAYAANRVLLNEGLRAIGFDTGNPSDGAFYAYTGISRFSNDSMSFCQTMLEEAGVAATPGIDFDRAGGSNYVRFSYAGKRDTIEVALERMRSFLQ